MSLPRTAILVRNSICTSAPSTIPSSTFVGDLNSSSRAWTTLPHWQRQHPLAIALEFVWSSKSQNLYIFSLRITVSVKTEPTPDSGGSVVGSGIEKETSQDVIAQKESCKETSDKSEGETSSKPGDDTNSMESSSDEGSDSPNEGCATLRTLRAAYDFFPRATLLWLQAKLYRRIKGKEYSALLVHLSLTLGFAGKKETTVAGPATTTTATAVATAAAWVHQARPVDLEFIARGVLKSFVSASQKLSILPRSEGALGFTYTPPNEDCYLLFIDDLRGRLVTLLGGFVAEEVAFSGCVSTGALDDIRRATDVAYKAIAEYGLNQTIGLVSLATLSGGGLNDVGGAVPWARDQGHLVDLVQKEVKVLLQSALEVALSVVRANPSVVEGLGAQLEGNKECE
ncbi:ATP-dependent zinc metalloprotease [Nymphaea thermarum]|nr:ATP-dependent zinc metalloprotease [Nymphaea thermarum]